MSRATTNDELAAAEPAGEWLEYWPLLTILLVLLATGWLVA